VNDLRVYGKSPYNIAVVHGGPGAAGEMAPVARELSSNFGILEPLQTAISVQGQVGELKQILEQKGDLPIIVIGFSWGAWLSFILAAQYPNQVKKLILIGSGSFEEKYVFDLQEKRFNRLSEKERLEIKALGDIISDPLVKDKNAAFGRFGKLYSKIDAFDFMDNKSEPIECQADIYRSVWPEAAAMRKSGELLESGKHIQCPVVAIHGDYDSHSAKGVQKPLSLTLKNFRFLLLKNCGHKPWIEQQARLEFYKILRQELI
jgi:pimeloyl-ACP methyl ester carboxylesterase